MIFIGIIGILFIGGGLFAWSNSTTAMHEILAAILNAGGFILIAIGIFMDKYVDTNKKLLAKLEEIRRLESVSSVYLEQIEPNMHTVAKAFDGRHVEVEQQAREDAMTPGA